MQNFKEAYVIYSAPLPPPSQMGEETSKEVKLSK